MNISKIDFHNFLYLFLTLIFCAMLTITQANSQENFKYRYKAEGVILHKNVQVPEPEPDPCLTGDIGTVCETDGAIYVGDYSGSRLYMLTYEGDKLNWYDSKDKCESENALLPTIDEYLFIYSNVHIENGSYWTIEEAYNSYEDFTPYRISFPNLHSQRVYYIYEYFYLCVRD